MIFPSAERVFVTSIFFLALFTSASVSPIYTLPSVPQATFAYTFVVELINILNPSKQEIKPMDNFLIFHFGFLLLFCLFCEITFNKFPIFPPNIIDNVILLFFLLLSKFTQPN